MADNLDSPKRKRKRLPWTEDGELAILDLWEKRAAKLHENRKNGPIYAEMASELLKLGYNYSSRDVQVKVANLTQRYRKEKAEMEISGGSPSVWIFYGRVHQIIGKFQANRCSELTRESISDFDIAPQPSSLTPSLSSPVSSPLLDPLHSPSPPLPSPSSAPSPIPGTSASANAPKKKRNGGLQEKVLKKIEELSTDISQHIKESQKNEIKWMKIEQEKADTLRQIANDNKELMNKILAFLADNTKITN